MHISMIGAYYDVMFSINPLECFHSQSNLRFHSRRQLAVSFVRWVAGICAPRNPVTRYVRLVRWVAGCPTDDWAVLLKKREKICRGTRLII